MYAICMNKNELENYVIYLEGANKLLSIYKQLCYYQKGFLSTCCTQYNYIKNKSIKTHSRYFKDQKLLVQKNRLSYSIDNDYYKVIMRRNMKILRITKVSQTFAPISVHFFMELTHQIQYHFVIQFKKSLNIWDQLYLTDMRRGKTQFIGQLTNQYNVYDTQISPDLRFIFISPYLHKLYNFMEKIRIKRGYVQFSDCQKFILHYDEKFLEFISLKKYECLYKINLSTIPNIIPFTLKVRSQQKQIIFQTRNYQSKQGKDQTQLKLLWLCQYELQ
ncbi:hypothetical protein pb186bvf_020311 [Paramecium bursaria]